METENESNNSDRTENESNNSDWTENESNSSDRTLASCENTNKRQKRKFKESNPAKRKHTALTVNQKIEICRAKEDNPHLKNIELACRYNSGESTISDI